MSSPRFLANDLVEIILLLLPPDEPEHLARASLVCKRWRRILTKPRFRRRYGDSPPVLGLLRNVGANTPDFVPTTAFLPPAPDNPGWIAMDCRHGRALFTTFNCDGWNLLDLLVWDPLQRLQQLVTWPIPYDLSRLNGFGAAVLCATRGCDHRSCQGGPFRIAIVYADHERDAKACMYPSETGAWSDFTGLHQPFARDDYENLPSLLVDDALYFTSGNKMGTIIECQLGTLRLSGLQKPPMYKNGRLMATDEGGLGFAAVDGGTNLTLWSRETGPAETWFTWFKLRVIDLELLFPDCGRFDSCLWPGFVSGFAEGTDVVFLSSQLHSYMLQLKSGRVKKMPGHSLKVFPYTSFYIPAATESVDSTYLGQ